MTPTTWNPSDISGVTLSNANLTALSTAAGGVRSVFSATAGKYYFEITWVASSANGVVGIANASAILTNVAVNLANAAGYNNSGAIEVNTVVQGQNLGSISVGTVVGCAVDLGAQLIWFRPSTTNIWNGNASNNPATGTGGISIASVGGSIYALAASTGSGPNVTANFGSTAFSGLVPSGFNAGLGVVPPADTFKILRSTTAGNRPSGAQAVYGAPYVNFADNQFGVVNASGQPVDLLLPNKNNFTFRNRIINGDMRWDQRNEGAVLNNIAGAVYSGDRWKANGNVSGKFSVACTSVSVANQNLMHLAKAIQGSSLSAYSIPSAESYGLQYYIEADAVVDLQWGSASALPIVLSFWALGTVAGTYAVAIRNQPGPTTRSYIATYSLAASTWTKIIIPIPGDTAGTWVTSGNAASIQLYFDFGSGATNQTPTANAWQAGNYLTAAGVVQLVANNGAGFNISGVQLEVGTIATPFEVLPPDVSLARCLRYYEKSYAQGTAVGTVTTAGCASAILLGLASAAYQPYIFIPFKVVKRAAPAINSYSTGTGSVGNLRNNLGTPADVAASAANIGPASFSIAPTSSLAAATGFSVLGNWTADADF